MTKPHTTWDPNSVIYFLVCFPKRNSHFEGRILWVLAISVLLFLDRPLHFLLTDRQTDIPTSVSPSPTLGDPNLLSSGALTRVTVSSVAGALYVPADFVT